MAKITTYDFIASNTKKTIFLMVLFPISLIFMVYILLFVFSFFSGPAHQPHSYQYALNTVNETAIWLLPAISVIAILWVAISYFFGQKFILSQTGAQEVTRESAPDIYNLTENLCIAAGLPVPKIYIINDNALNAFATGRDPNHSYVVLTSGLVNALDKPELEGVIAHELSHIGNRDIRLMLITILCISFATVVANILLRVALLRGRGNSRNSGGAQLFLLLLALVFYLYGYLVAPLIRLAVSRTREFQADASAALLTRNPQGLAGALRRISGNSEVKNLQNNEPMAAMCIESPLSANKRNSVFNKMSGLFSTHPPTEERIKKLLAMDGSARS